MYTKSNHYNSSDLYNNLFQHLGIEDAKFADMYDGSLNNDDGYLRNFDHYSPKRPRLHINNGNTGHGGLTASLQENSLFCIFIKYFNNMFDCIFCKYYNN